MNLDALAAGSSTAAASGAADGPWGLVVAAGWLLGAYLLGSVSFAVVFSRLAGLQDPRAYGSGNPGATNVLRSGRKGVALATLLADALKGFFPVFVARQFFQVPDLLLGFIGLAAFLGHLWPVFFRFQGGKGVATAAGALFGMNALLGLAALATWVLVAAATRYSSAASLSAAVAAPLAQMLFWGGGPLLLGILPMSLLLIWRHQGNIRKLMSGTESRLGQKAEGAAAPPVQTHGPGATGGSGKRQHNPTPRGPHRVKHGRRH